MRLGTQAFAGRSQLDLTSSAILQDSICSLYNEYTTAVSASSASRCGWLASVPSTCLLRVGSGSFWSHIVSDDQQLLVVHMYSFIIMSQACSSWYTLSEISSGVRRRGRGVRNNKKEAGMAGSALSIDQLLLHYSISCASRS